MELSRMNYVLVIEDCVLHQEAIVKGLQKGGIDSIGVVYANDALMLLTSDIPDAIVIEPLVFRRQGYDFFQHLQNSPALRRIPILVLTAASKQEVQTFLRHTRGRITCMSKPYNLPTVIGCVSQWV
jgi:chemosensory pili system protein ChpA (sensor histidine kinase/response regulator)